MKLRALVVDDEPLARRRLVRMLARVEELEVAGEAADGLEAEAQLRALAPDLVFLDIQMPGLDGLALAARGALPPIVFTTAHAEHAVRAFELAAADYLLKPIEQPRLEAAVARVRANRRALDAAAVAALLARLHPRAAEPKRIAARSGKTVHLIDPRSVTRIWASDKYAVLLHDGREHLLEESLNTLEQDLASAGFLRVHRAELIRLDAVKALHQEEGGAVVELEDGQRAPVSRRLLGALEERLGLR